jgi:hypothetical protein
MNEMNCHEIGATRPIPKYNSRFVMRSPWPGHTTVLHGLSSEGTGR